MNSHDLPTVRPFHQRSSGLCLFCVGMLAASAHAASITFVGTETGEAVLNWSNDEVAKTHDVNGTERFGNAGFYQITPGVFGNTWVDAAPSDNNLGITQLYPSLYSTPAFLNGIPLGAAGLYVNTDEAPFFMNPEGDMLIRQGSLLLDFENNQIATAPNNVEGRRHIAFVFTLGETASFRLGIAGDGLANPDYAVDYVSVTHGESTEEFSTPLNRDGVPDMVFFDIEGNAGDQFTVVLWQANEELSNEVGVGFSLITFDLKPDSDPTLSYVLDGNNFTLSWEPEVSGWILESSTDLGVSDDWTAVTDPPVVNNSVTLDISDAPQRFFRLRNDP